MLRQREDMELRLAKIRAKEKAQRERYLKGDQKYKKRKTDTAIIAGNIDDEEQFLLEDYDSDHEQSKFKNGGSGAGSLSAATLEMMEKLGMNIGLAREEEEEIEDQIKVSSHFNQHGNSNNNRSSTVHEPIPNWLNSSTNSAASTSHHQSKPTIVMRNP
jgi:hypothetical protein